MREEIVMRSNAPSASVMLCATVKPVTTMARSFQRRVTKSRESTKRM